MSYNRRLLLSAISKEESGSVRIPDRKCMAGMKVIRAGLILSAYNNSFNLLSFFILT